MATEHLTVAQVVETLKKLSPSQLHQVQRQLSEARLEQAESAVQAAMLATAVESADWWNAEGDREWDAWYP